LADVDAEQASRHAERLVEHPAGAPEQIGESEPPPVDLCGIDLLAELPAGGAHRPQWPGEILCDASGCELVGQEASDFQHRPHAVFRHFDLVGRVENTAIL
jgi:hypothetical protein